MSVTVSAPLAEPSLLPGTQTRGGFLCHSTTLERTDKHNGKTHFGVAANMQENFMYVFHYLCLLANNSTESD